KHTRRTRKSISNTSVHSRRTRNGRYSLYHEDGKRLFCENETNNMKIYDFENDSEYVKDGINHPVLHGKSTVNPENNSSRFAVWHQLALKPGESKTVKRRLCKSKLANPWADFDALFHERMTECDEFYSETIKSTIPETHQVIAKSAFS